MARPYNRNIVRVLRLSRTMMLLADRGDESRKDAGCGVLYGMLRDSAYKLRLLAEKEIILHQESGIWDGGETNPSGNPGMSAHENYRKKDRQL
jgi:hypothetical protein